MAYSNLALFVVSKVKDCYIECHKVGDGSTAIGFELSVPKEAVAKLVGRWLWVPENWGGKSEIHSWVDMPAQPEVK